jgi:hypothetical protein
MSYRYYADELERLPPDDGYGIAIQLRSGDKYTKWMTLNAECKGALQEYLSKTGEGTPAPDADPDSMTDAVKATYWQMKFRELQAREETARAELAKYLANPICPATWHHIVGAVRELLLFRDCAKKAQPRRAILSDPDNGKEGDPNYVNNNLAVCLEFLNLAERGRA